MKQIIILVLSFFLVESCSIEPQNINYGKDACSYCKMNIVDQQHAAEIVTKKGKVFKYDAIECLLKDKNNNKTENVEMYLVMDYDNPNTFLNAPNSSFLVSKNIPSPMGAFLSAFEGEDKAEKQKSVKTGILYNWIEIQKQFY